MRRNTWVYLVIFIILAGVLWVIRNKPEWVPFKGEPTPTLQADEFVFNADTADVSAIMVEASDGRATQVKRGMDQFWIVEKPTPGMADPALAEAAASQATALRILNKIEETPPDSSVGLDTPQFVITVKINGQGEQVLKVGELTPTQTGYYARLSDGKVIIVSANGIDALTNLLDYPPFVSPTVTPAP